MASTLQRVWALPVLAVVATLLSPVSAQSNKIINDLAYILPIVILAIAIIVIAAIIYFVMRQARYGYFCCIKPRVIRLPDSPTPSENSDREEEGEAESNPAPQGADGDTTAPGYSIHPNSVIPPPDYQDALQDVLVVRGNDQTGPPDYANNEGDEAGAYEPTSQSGQPEPSSAATGDREETVNQQQNLEDVDLEDSTEDCDDSTPLNP